jgi:hypothetical protein
VNTRKRKTAAGAYYTREDVAGFIARSTILPWLLDAAAEQLPSLFLLDGPVWQLLRHQPERYLYPELLIANALPTETELESLARRGRCRELLQRLHDGAVATVNDLVTLNLDCRRFILDLIAEPSLTELRAALAAAANRITVLDPTCGDGAILRAALQVLEEILLACGRASAEPGARSAERNVRIVHSILARNLHGVDVRAEAVADCRANLLRLLSDGASSPELTNIRCGNALTPAFWQQTFPAIQKAGGFDVVIGNPPYLTAERQAVTPAEFHTAGCPDIYAWILERSAALLKPGGRSGMIVPLSLAFSRAFQTCRELLFASYETNWFSAFGRIPSALFDFDIRVRNVIHLGHRAALDAPRLAYSTRLHRWYDEARPQLFPLLHYVPFRAECWQGRVPLLNSAKLAAALEARLATTTARLGDSLSRTPTPHVLWYKKTAYNWLTFCRRLPPCFDAEGQPSPQTQFDMLFFPTAWQRDLALLLLNGKLAFAYWSVVGDDFHVARWMFGGFPIDLRAVPLSVRRSLLPLVPRLERAMHRATAFKRNAGKRVGTYNLARCRKLTDVSDRLFAEWLGWQEIWPEVELLVARQVKTAIEALA